MLKRPPLVVICGIPGSGKSTIGAILCGLMPGAVHIETDAVRRMIAEPNYSRPESSFIYEACVDVAQEALKRGRPVVLDRTFARADHRRSALTRLRRSYGPMVVAYVTCKLGTAERRNASRNAVVPGHRLRRIYDYFDEPAGALKVNSDEHSAEENANLILAAISRQQHESNTQTNLRHRPVYRLQAASGGS